MPTPNDAHINRCGKLTYASRRDATTALKALLSRQTQRTRRHLHSYACPDCGQWHLGHAAPRPRRGQDRGVGHGAAREEN